MLSCFGCTTQVSKPAPQPESKASGRVTGGLIEAPASERYAGEAGAHYEQPLASPDNPLPAYPSDLLSKRLPPFTVRVRVVVNEMGLVTSVIAIDQPDANQLPFVESVRSAVQGWKFTQLVKVIPGPTFTRLVDAFGSEAMYPGKATALPFHQDYQFVFSQTQGKPNVSVHSAPSPES